MMGLMMEIHVAILSFFWSRDNYKNRASGILAVIGWMMSGKYSQWLLKHDCMYILIGKPLS